MGRWRIFTLCLIAVGCFAGDEIFSPSLIVPLPAKMTITTLALSPDVEYVAAGTQEGKVLVWSLHSQDPVLSFETDGTILDVAFSSDNRFVYSCSASGRVYRADLLVQGGYAVFETFSFPLPVYPVDTLADRPWRYVETGQAMAAFSPQADRLATSALDGWIRIFDVRTGGLLADFAPLGTRAWERPALLALSPCGRYLGLSVQGQVWLWQLDYNEIFLLPLKDLFVTNLAVGPKGRALVLVTEANDVFLFSLDGKEKSLLLSLGETINAVVISPDGLWIALAANETIYLLALAEKGVVHKIPGWRPVVFSWDGRYLAYLSADGTKLVVRPLGSLSRGGERGGGRSRLVLWEKVFAPQGDDLWRPRCPAASAEAPRGPALKRLPFGFSQAVM